MLHHSMAEAQNRVWHQQDSQKHRHQLPAAHQLARLPLQHCYCSPNTTLRCTEVKTLTTYSIPSHVFRFYLISFLQNLVSKNNYSLLLMRGCVQKRLKKGFIRKPTYELKPSLHCYSAFLLSILNPHGRVCNHSGFFSSLHFTMLESNKINL